MQLLSQTAVEELDLEEAAIEFVEPEVAVLAMSCMSLTGCSNND